MVREHEYRVGEVISFVEDGKTVTHRLVAVNPNGTTDTKGDANPTMDPWHVPTSDIIGSVVAAPRMVGFLLVYVRSPLGIASIALVALCMWEMWAFGEVSDLAQKGKGRPVTADASSEGWRQTLGDWLPIEPGTPLCSMGKQRPRHFTQAPHGMRLCFAGKGRPRHFAQAPHRMPLPPRGGHAARILWGILGRRR